MEDGFMIEFGFDFLLKTGFLAIHRFAMPFDKLRYRV
jgi:hypothetical protein